ncbi:hypothetical protein P885DRAFT_48100 [Corynascus similis CBS 632.67]
MDVDAAQAQWTDGKKQGTPRDKSSVTCYNCGKKGHYKRDCRSKKKDWKPVPGKETATTEQIKNVRFAEVAAASFTQEDHEDAIDATLENHELPYTPDVDTEEDDGEANSDDSEYDEHGHAVALELIVPRWNSETGLAQFDLEGEVAPSHWAIYNAYQIGCHMEQERNGNWKLKEGADEPYKPNIAFLQQKVVSQRKEIRQLQELRVSLEEHDRNITQRLEEAEAHVQELQEETDRINRALEGHYQAWNGPIRETYRKQGSGEVRNPEWEYQRHREERIPQEERLNWEQYWESHQYTSIGRSTGYIQEHGYGTWNQAHEGDAARLDPRRNDHIQVPWFQCFTDACRYHFKEKFDHDHWPVRPNDANGASTTMEWTYDMGQGASDQLWSISVQTEEDSSTLTARPKRAWPGNCTAMHPDRMPCPSQNCIIHMRLKLNAWHTYREWIAEYTQHYIKRNKESARERQIRHTLERQERQRTQQALTEWLQEMDTIDAASRSEDRDALNRQQSLGNGSGPSKGPVNH